MNNNSFPIAIKILQKLHGNNMGIEKTQVSACELVYFMNINADIKNIVKQCATHMGYQQTQPYEKIIPYEMLHKPWEVGGVNISTIKSYIIVHCRLLQEIPCCQEGRWPFRDSLINKVVKIVFANFELPQKIVSDAGTNFISDKFR